MENDMNFDEAIKAHTDWKIKLTIYIKKPDGSLKPAEVCLDNKCKLGQWIYGEGAAHKSIPEYSTLKTEHAKFHKAAADIIQKADSGQSVTEDMAFGTKSVFASASTAVVTSIMAMRKKVNA